MSKIATFQRLPPEILALISASCDMKDVASLARANKCFHDIVNPILYRRNLTEQLPMDSCILVAAQAGNVSTLQRALAYGADINVTGARDDADLDLDWNYIPGRKRYFASALHLALQNGHRDTFRFLLQQGADVHIPGRDFCPCKKYSLSSPSQPGTPNILWYPLHYAIRHQGSANEDMAKELVKHGAYLSSRHQLGLHEAVTAGKAELVDLLLQNPAVDALDRNNHGESALHCTSRIADESTCALLIRQFVALGVPVDIESKTGTPLDYAIQWGNYAGAIALLDHGAKLSALQILDGQPLGPLHAALSKYEKDPERRKKRFELISRLIDAGADVEAYSHGCPEIDGPPLWFATLQGDVEPIQLLVNKGARADIHVVGNTPDDSGSRTLISSLFRVREEDGEDPWIPRYEMPSRAAGLKLLLQNGSRLDPVEDEESALSVAAMGTYDEDVECLRFLLENSTADNVSLEHAHVVLEWFSDPDTDGNDEAQDLLRAFMDRVYPGWEEENAGEEGTEPDEEFEEGNEKDIEETSKAI